MSFHECKPYIHKVKIQKAKIENLIKNANSIVSIFEKIPITKESTTIITTNYYEAIKELLIALALSQGIKSNNHECLILWFSLKYKEQELTKDIFELKDKRNKNQYEGTPIELQYLINKKPIINKAIKTIKKYINNSLK
jgi:uncharacterized protein (UPF0332 family)